MKFSPFPGPAPHAPFKSALRFLAGNCKKAEADVAGRDPYQLRMRLLELHALRRRSQQSPNLGNGGAAQRLQCHTAGKQVSK